MLGALEIRRGNCLRSLGTNPHWPSWLHESSKSIKKHRDFFRKTKIFEIFQNSKKQTFSIFGNFKFSIFRFFLDDEKIFFTRNFFIIWIGRSAHVRVGRWRVGFLSVTAFESQKYRKCFKIPQNHKTKKIA